jgi:hypothetical protein
VDPIEVQKYLSGIDYPCEKQDLIDAARNNGADENVISELEGLPDDTYESPADVSEALGDVGTMEEMLDEE